MDQPWVYIVLFGLVLIVYAKILPKKAPLQQGATVNEIEETMEHFAAEIEEQNQAVIQLFTQTKHEYEQQLNKLSGRIEWLEKQNNSLSQEVAKLLGAQDQWDKQIALLGTTISSAHEKPQHYSVPAPAPAEPEVAVQTSPEAEEPPVSLMNIKKRYAELFDLYEQGKSTDYIAKKMGMNKGEINLIVQLAKQEESLRV
ncbi:DUF6115 domain-containing protein [Paenibacillus thalictri]|uniref:DUF2802 domain-containing protein n=1 Tax=Paenibacillus thalictri TaxID=2527873 RepID=A0A4Q9DNU9_9BACL|nr:hypothetical protein [Paenibacillus thalictri]TBL77756.1 hypothetical protein EYB31_16570 [Paenibacillus thalictri]